MLHGERAPLEEFSVNICAKIFTLMSFLASKILMVRPAAFGYNPETAESNAFQKQVNLSDTEIQLAALEEFDRMVDGLKRLGVDVVVADDLKETHTPDAIFPNNWFSTHPDGTFCLYPMESEARRLERKLADTKEFPLSVDRSKTVDLTGFEEESKFLEGTGSLILDHENRIAYACLSSRTDIGVLEVWADKLGFEPVTFRSYDSEGQAIYHTNVMMCLGDEFAVVCLDSVVDEDERGGLIKALESSGKQIIPISFDQMNDFAGNMLLVANAEGEKILVMSKRAFDSLDEVQIEQMKAFAKLAPFAINTIEDSGGGSARCMIAEVF